MLFISLTEIYNKNTMAVKESEIEWGGGDKIRARARKIEK